MRSSTALLSVASGVQSRTEQSILAVGSRFKFKNPNPGSGRTVEAAEGERAPISYGPATSHGRALQADEALPAFQSEFAAGTGTYRQKDEEEKGRSSQC